MFSSADGSVPPAAAVAAKASERILCISPWSSDLRFLQKVLNAPGRQIDLAETIKQAAKHLAGRDLSLIITETDLPDGTWHDVLRKSSVNGHAPAVLVVCRLADERLWAEVLNLGAYDVINKPFIAEEIARSSLLAMDSWRRQNGKNGFRAPD